MEEAMLDVIKTARQHYQEEGFIILGVFGSRARGDYQRGSDLDLLYRLESRFFARYPGWFAAGRLQEIRAELCARTGMEIDMANEGALDPVGRKYILPETILLHEADRRSLGGGIG